jgi:hypothetical protein
MVLLNAHFEDKISNGASLNFDCVAQRFAAAPRPAKCRCHYNAPHLFLFKSFSGAVGSPKNWKFSEFFFFDIVLLVIYVIY